MKNKIIVTTLLLSLVFLVSIQTSEASKSYGISLITKTPQILHQNENMTVTVEFENSSNIYSVKLLVCQLEPVYRCDAFPRIMQNDTADIFTADYLILFDIGTVVGLSIIITYENFTMVHLPETAELFDLEIVEPETGTFYIAAGTVSDIEENSGFGIFIVSVSVLVVTIIIKRKRRKSIYYEFR